MATIVGDNSANTLPGTNGKDVILGKGGDDVLTGGADNDKLDGGKGTDTAVFSGNYADYIITFATSHGFGHGHGHDKNELTVKDTISGRDGTDFLKDIEFLQFADALVEVSTGKVTLLADPGEVRLYDGGYHLVHTYSDIGAAVADALNGYTVVVGAGTYTEQVVVNGIDDLTIQGMPGAVVEAPAVLQQTGVSPTNGRSVDGLITVLNSSNVTIESLTVDGLQHGASFADGQTNPTMAGISYLDSSGTIDGVTVISIRESDAGFGVQRNVGIYVANTSPSPGTPNTPTAEEAAALNSIVIKNSTVTDFQKGGIVAVNADVDIHDNTVTGYGPTANQAQNGIQVSGSTGSIEDNVVSAIGYTLPNWAASGILTFENRDLVIDGNEVTGTGAGHSILGIAAEDSVGGRITNNTISSVGWAIDQEDYPGLDWPDPMQPGSGYGFKYDYSSNQLSGIGYNGLWFQPDATSTSAFNVVGSTGNDAIYGAAANDRLDGYDGDDLIYGEAGDDKLDGGKGDDSITGGEGDDKIDGGKGTDTAVFSGNYADYEITEVASHGHHHGHGYGHGHGPGEDKVIVTDNVGSDGTDTVTNVEFLQFADATYNVASGDVWGYQVNVSVDLAAQDPSSPGNLYAGSGIPATNFGIARNEDAGIELGLQVIYRQGPTVATTDDYADGVLHFSVNGGPQWTGNGSSVDNAARASWNFEYSIATGLNGETTDLNDFTFKLLYDVDPGTGISYRTLTLEAEGTPQPVGQSGFQWRDEGTGLVFIADDEGTANVTQNSENYAFEFFQGFLTGAYGPGNTFAGPAYFDIMLQAYDPFNNLVAQNHISVDVIL